MTKPKAIFLSGHLPSNRMPAAGQALAYRNLKRLSCDYDIFLISFVNKNEEAYVDMSIYDFCLDVHLFRISYFDRLVRGFLNPLSPIKTAVRTSVDVQRTLKNILEMNSVVFFHAEYTSVGGYIEFVSHEIHTEIVSQDVVYQSFDRYYQEKTGIVKLFYGLEFLKQKKWELATLARFDKVIALNIKDRVILENDGVRNVTVEYPEVPEWMLNVNRDNVDPYSVMFLGAMNRDENEDAIIYFVESVFPRLVGRYPNCIFYIVGTSPSAKVLRMACSNIVVTGFVDSLEWYFQKAQVAVAPLRYGAGIKTKVLETLAARIPTICTDVAAEGVNDDKNLIIANCPDEIFDRIVHVFEG